MHGPTAARMRSRLRAQAFHRLDGGLDHPAQRAAPTRMGRGDDTSLCVGEQHGRAIGRQHTKRNAGSRSDHGIRLGPLAGRPRPAHDERGRAVHLVRRRKIAGTQMRRHATPVLPDRRRLIL